LVCLMLWLLGYTLGAPLIIGLFGSFAFGSTAVASLGASTIPIHVLFAGALLISLATRANFPSSLAAVFAGQPLAQLTCALIAYAAATAFILPRLFAHGATIVVPIDLTIVELPLQPVPGNFNQTGYMLLNGLLFLAFAILLQWRREADIRRAFLTWASLQALLGLIDLTSKTAGLGDILDPVRTSAYVNLGDHAIDGFWRVVGAFPEASAYAAAALQALAFALVDWRLTRSRLSLVVSLTLVVLLALSTSSTGYVGLAGLLLCLILFAFALRMHGPILFDHAAWLGVSLAMLAVVLALHIYDDELFDPWIAMVFDATINKPISDSGVERAYWNQLSLAAFLDTQGIGVGLGSTRSSSWPISVLAQLGVIGAIGFAVAVGALILGLLRFDARRHGSLPASASMAALVGLFASCFGGSGADPGALFFIALAIVSAHFASRPRITTPTLNASAWQ